jgi:tRNA/tmRNA/rRNA uracil-C5-methylase (TrmA/RlmC/RlmD family)
MPIIRFIEDKLKAIESNTLIDLFCGNGFFSILFGDSFQNIIGYDWVESSIQTATENLNRLFPGKKIIFEKKDLLQFKDVFSDSKSIPEDSILILDPPRNGIGIKLSEYILNSSIKNILYVSCNPNSQIDDLKILSGNYEILSGLITDPYPYTPHLESVLHLKRKEMEPVQV